MKDKDEDIGVETKSITISELSSSVVQAVYKEMLDTTESLGKSFQPGKIVDRDDIEAFCRKFVQTSQQYNIKALKTVFIIKRDEDRSEKYTSLDRFLASDSQGGRITAGVSVELSFLIMPPNFDKYQEYKAILIINSSDFTEKPQDETFIMNLMGFPTFTFSIDYVDYSVARSFLSMTEDWHKSLKYVQSSKFMNFFKKRFNYFTDSLIYQNAAALIVTMAAVYSCYFLIRVWEIEESNRGLLEFAAFSFTVIYISRYLAITSISFFLRNLGNYRIPNFLVFNRRDKENVEKYNTEKISTIRRSVLALSTLLLTILANIFSTYLYAKIF